MIDVYTEGSYRLHLDFLLEMVTGGYYCHFQENEHSITLTITDDKHRELYKRETDFLDKRRSIEVFFNEVVQLAFNKK